MNLVDSSGWIEYLLDTERADLFAQAIEHRNDLLVPVIALFEVHKVLSRKMPTELVAKCLDVMRLGRVLEIAISAPFPLPRLRCATGWPWPMP